MLNTLNVETRQFNIIFYKGESHLVLVEKIDSRTGTVAAIPAGINIPRVLRTERRFV